MNRPNKAPAYDHIYQVSCSRRSRAICGRSSSLPFGKNLMKTLLIYLFTCSGVACFAAEPAKTKLLFPAVVTCFMEKIDSRSSCSTVMTKVPEPEPRLRWSSGMTCGWSGRVSELHWEFLGSESGADVYQVSRRFPADAPQSMTVTKTIRFTGSRVVVFEDQYQVIVFDPAKSSAK